MTKTATLRPFTPATAVTALAAMTLSACTMGTDAASPSGSSSTSSSSSSNTSTTTTPALPSASQAWSQTQDTIDGYTSLKVDAHDDPKEELPSAVISGDLDTDPTEFVFKSDDMGDFTLRRMGTQVYLKGNNEYWKAVEKEDSSAKGATNFADRWVKTSSSRWNNGDFSDFSVKDILDAMTDDNDPKWSTLAKPEAHLSRDAVAGTAAYKITGADGDTVVWTSADGKYNLLKIEDASPGSDEFGRAMFSRWNEKFTFAAPKDAFEVDGGPTKTT